MNAVRVFVRWFLITFTIAFVVSILLVGIVRNAWGVGFTDSAPTVTCQTAMIDPPTWVLITFTGTIGTVPVSITVDYNSTAHAVADISQYTTGTGPIPYSLTATGNFGKYGTHTSLTATGTLDCHDPVTTTTSTTSTTSTTISTTTTECQDHTLPCAGPPVTDHPPVTFPVHPINVTPTTVAPALPFTGGDTGGLAVAGGGLVLLGVTGLAIASHRRSVR